MTESFATGYIDPYAENRYRQLEVLTPEVVTELNEVTKDKVKASLRIPADPNEQTDFIFPKIGKLNEIKSFLVTNYPRLHLLRLDLLSRKTLQNVDKMLEDIYSIFLFEQNDVLKKYRLLTKKDFCALAEIIQKEENVVFKDMPTVEAYAQRHIILVINVVENTFSIELNVTD